MFLNIQINLIILKTYDQHCTVTTKKSLHIIFKTGNMEITCNSHLASIATLHLDNPLTG